ncbi:MAG TPA: hypothetical protein VMI94_05815 [Bryobacteraceae bacterium]|nr:hypothetical protein [Bryobacteraceae bacterium]
MLDSHIPQRMALAGGWIDQPFVSRHNPKPPGSMVVVSLEPEIMFMDRCGMASSTRSVATRIWNGVLPERPPAELVRELYWAENTGKADPSGSQDMVGLIYPGISRLDYDAAIEGGLFPAHIESCCEPGIARWVEEIFYLVPINQRPAGYNPLATQNLAPACIWELGQTGKDCFDAIVNRDILRLGASMNSCMACWEAILPHTVADPAIDLDLKAILSWFQAHYPGAMYSGCGGGYMIVVSEAAVPGSLRVKVRTG